MMFSSSVYLDQKQNVVIESAECFGYITEKGYHKREIYE